MIRSRISCLALLALFAAACGSEGTVFFDLAFPPGTDGLPAEAVAMRLALDGSGRDVTVPIQSDGSFSLSLSVTADRTTERATLEALDAGGNVLVRGRSAPIPLAALDDLFVFYMAVPGQFSEAPIAFASARHEMATAALSYGVLFAGGRNQAGDLLDELTIYNIYTHTFQAGLALPEARANMAAIAGSTGFIYLFGGEGPNAAAEATLWRFDSNVPPTGSYNELAVSLSLARSGAAMAPLGYEQFLITGDPVLLLDGTNALVAPLMAAASTTNQATTVTTIVSSTEVATVFAGPFAVDRFYPATGELLSDAIVADLRSEHASARLAEDEVIIVGGVDQASALLTTALRVGVRGDITVVPLLSQGRRFPAVCATRQFLVVAGGYDAAGVALTDAEVFDSSTLQAIATIPLISARGQAIATPTSNDSIMLSGGKDGEQGLPVLPIEIFTP